MVRVPWLVPAVEAVLLLLLVARDRVGLAKRTSWLHRLTLTLVCLLVASALWTTALLVYDLIKGTGVANKPAELLATGAVVWLGNNLSSGPLYWLIDSGGPIARSRKPLSIDFAFPQQMSPELAPPGWRPVFLD